jgi:hypothetical protein
VANVLIISNIGVFDAAGMATGPGLRAWGLAAALATRGHRIVLAERRQGPAGSSRPLANAAGPAGRRSTHCVGTRGRRGPGGGPATTLRSGVSIIGWNENDRDLRPRVALADVVIVQPGRYVAEVLAGAKVRCLIVDLYNPVVTEAVAMAAPTEPGLAQFGGAMRWYRYFLNRGDFFLCAGERQRQFTLGALAHAGRLNPLTDPDDLLRVVPMGVESAPPPAQPAERLLRGRVVPENAELLLWPGGIYRWFEGVTAVRALARLRAARPGVALVFVGAENPLDPVAARSGVVEAKAAAQELGVLEDGVHFVPWQPYEQRAAIYREADLAVLTHRPLLEAWLSWRTRSLDCLWGGLPLVVTRGDEVGEIAERAGAAVCVPPEDPDSLAAALGDLLAHPERRAGMAMAARRLATESWSRERVTEPLHEICLSPRPAPDRAAVSRGLGVGRAARPDGPPSLARRVVGRLVRSFRRSAPPPRRAVPQPASGVRRPETISGGEVSTGG